MIVEGSSILLGYFISKNEFLQDVKDFGDKINFFKKKKGGFEDISKKYKNKEFMFGDVIEMEAYGKMIVINTMEGKIYFGNKDYSLLEDDECFIETVKFTETEISFEVKKPAGFWHTTYLRMPYAILFHPEFLGKFEKANVCDLTNG